MTALLYGSAQLTCAVMSAYVRRLFGFYYGLVPWVRVLYQRSASRVSVLFHCGRLAVGADVWSGVGVQLWRAAPAPHRLCGWVQPASTFMYKHATCHHTSRLCWTALIYVMTMLYCAQYYCCLLRTVGMNLAVWLCYNITARHVAQLCQAYIVCCVL